MADLIRVEKEGLYCEPGNFYIDPWQPVQNALITHAHGDHAHIGSKIYYSSEKSAPLSLGPIRRHRKFRASR